jgi:hypothetical protein
MSCCSAGEGEPDLIIVGGGVSEKADKFLPLLTVQTQVVAAQLRNDAGIVGAALAVLYQQTATDTAAGDTGPGMSQPAVSWEDV